ncbi:autotransporter outer membrane beta-barrel domain-containing protein [Brucella pseudogrignonensis]|uniref:autotransporter family protein n=1 Tax=Brucella pseudogrignonensis TaxID=419475 RepID=UPI0028B68047|nr:autotransporter outer membrane beta-barrel domain-containing protein [Brucella pseudogrignonensis]MDT6939470.1 autotransporter outer membrane beta-barrel domain-containing protein [Brucella pseudogrignonensis]
MIGGEGLSGTINAISDRATSGGGGGGGTGIIIGDEDSGDYLEVDINTTIKGGNGGNGGNAALALGAGGSGGNGGAGVYIYKSLVINNGTIIGGNGGSGGNSVGETAIVGKGGDGGVGVLIGKDSQLINNKYIKGGMGGLQGISTDDSSHPSINKGGNGVELLGNNHLENTISGEIYGGLNQNANQELGGYAIAVYGKNNIISNNGIIKSAYEGEDQKAILIDGENNKLVILKNSRIFGIVKSTARGNTLELAGEETASFEVVNIGDDKQYQGFDYFSKTGESTWYLVGETNALTPWIVKHGFLSIDKDENLGSFNGTLTLDGGTLELRAWDEEPGGSDTPLQINRSIILTENDGVIYTNTSDGIIYSEIQGEGELQKSGEHRLTLVAENTYTGHTYIEDGELEIGNGGNNGSIIGNIEIHKDAALSFNRSDTFWIEHMVAGQGNIAFDGTGNAVWSTQSEGFTGITRVSSGILSLYGSLGGLMSVGSYAMLSGSAEINSLITAGKIAPGDSVNYGEITITKGYLGLNGSSVLLKAALGDDNSTTDRLIVLGDTVGESKLLIWNMSGSGGDTVKGIEVIRVEGESDARFNLVGDYNLPSGTPAVVAGAHSYVLQKGSVTDPADGNWYLRSNFSQEVCPTPEPGQPSKPCQPCVTPSNPSRQPCRPCPSPNTPTEQPGSCSTNSDIYQPGVPLYSSYAHIIHSLNTLPTMRERVGNRYWTGISAHKISQGDGLGTDTESAPDPALKEVLTDAGLIWARVEAAHTRNQLQNSTTNNKYRSDQWSLRAGIDNQVLESTYGKVIAGVWLQYDTAKAGVTSYFGNGTVDINSYGVGAALTWLSNDGFYVDGQARHSWSKSDISSETLNRSLITDTKGKALALSLEAGQRIVIDDRWSWTPQAQLTWAQTSLDDFTDPYNADVSFEKLTSLTARIGLSAQYSASWQDKNGYTSRTNAYSITNIYRELLDRSTKMNISDELIYIGNEDKTWGELGFGGTYAFFDDKYALFGEAAIASPFKQIDANYSLRGNVGFRVNW